MPDVKGWRSSAWPHAGSQEDGALTPIWHRTHQLDGAAPLPAFEALESAWVRLARTSMPPRLEAWPLQEFAQILPNVALVEIEREDVSTARYVLFGGRLRDLLGQDPAGRLVSEVYPATIAAEVLDTFRRVVQSGRPETSRRDFKVLTWNFGYHRWVGPFGVGSEVTHLMVALFPVQPALRIAAQWKAAVARWRAHNNNAGTSQDELAWAQMLRPAQHTPRDLWYV